MNTLIGLLNTIAAMGRIVVGLNPRGQTVNNWARLVVLAVLFGVVVPLVVWPFVLLGVARVGLTGLTAAVAFVPLVAFPVFVIILVVAYPLLSGILVTIPGVRAFFLWLIVVIFAELVIGLYFVAVPVWNSPGLIPVLALLAVILGMWLFLKRQLRWQWGGWITPLLATAIVAVTIVFFFASWFGGDETEAKAEEVTATQAAREPQEFTLDAGKEKDTVETGPGTKHWIMANRDWLLLSMTPEGEIREYRMAAGRRSILGTGVAGPARVKALTDGTTLRFERTNR